ncbi:MAG: hypothetical protein IKS83_01895, partial [Victivallales bacterium]|nr:hypothetical protein [Victivallales bacterium]
RGGIRLGYEETKYDHNGAYDNFNRYVVNGLVDFRNDKFSVTAESGMEHLNYDGETGHIADADGQWKFNGRFSLKYRPVSNFETGLALSTGRENSSVGYGRNASVQNKIAMSAKWMATSHIVLLGRLGVSDNNEKESTMDNREFFTELQANYIFTNGISLYVGYKYRNIQFRYDSDYDYSVTEYFMGCRYTF